MLRSRQPQQPWERVSGQEATLPRRVEPGPQVLQSRRTTFARKRPLPCVAEGACQRALARQQAPERVEGLRQQHIPARVRHSPLIVALSYLLVLFTFEVKTVVGSQHLMSLNLRYVICFGAYILPFQDAYQKMFNSLYSLIDRLVFIT